MPDNIPHKQVAVITGTSAGIDLEVIAATAWRRMASPGAVV